MSGVLPKLKRYGRIAKQARHGVRYLVNDEVYWDRYASDWEARHRPPGETVVGSEWKNQEVFLELLRKHGSREMTALEIGCGGGRITRTAAEVFRHVEAADVSREMLRKAREAVTSPNVRFSKLDGFTLDQFEDRSVDLVFSHDVFVHFSSLQVHPYLREIKRVLRPGGTGLISFYNFVRHFELFKETSLEYWHHRRLPPHLRVHFVTEEMLRTMLSDLDLELVETNTENFLIIVFRA